MGVDGDDDSGRDDVDDLQHQVNRQITDTERVSQIFTVTRVCRQLYIETALIQYKNNYFHFSSPSGLEAFTKQLTFVQRCAITAISIDEPYVLQRFQTLNDGGSSFNLSLPVPDMRQILPGLRKIFVKPEGVQVLSGATTEDKLIRVIGRLGIGGKGDKGLWIGCFDVLDETAILDDACGFLIKPAEDGTELSP
jgi:hypothetical protein